MRFILILLIVFNSLIAGASSLLIEAESFKNIGGWVIDQQFMDLMGSPYLLAHGMGVPVEDASTEVVFPENGEYYVYVRTYNWTSPWKKGEGPGKFVISVGQQRIKKILGDNGDSWMWQYAGRINVKKKKNIVKLHDLTGFDGRCDAIYFTKQRGDYPPSEIKELELFRREALGLDKNPHIASEHDLVVIGGGIAGMSAAVSAARLGLKVALIHDRPVLGGNNSSEVRVHMGGRIEVGEYKELGGLQKEFAPTRKGNAQPAEYYEDQKKIEWIKKEKNVELYLNYRVIKVEKYKNKIVSVIAKNIENGEELKFKSSLFSDCTGDGTIGYLAGADFRMGRESRYEFGESIAPEQEDKLTMGTSIQWYSVEDKKNSSFPEFSYGIEFNEESCEKVFAGEWTWETGMNYDQINDFERIRDYGMMVVYSNWSYLKNKLMDNSHYKKRKLGWVAYIGGKRESRRLMGDYILKEDDIRKHIFHEDASFTTTWSIDLHSQDPKNSVYFPGNEFKAVTKHILIYPYAVPYRCLYSRNVDNLFMAGRNISVTHVALGTVRVMRTTGMMGEVVGMAASLCKKYDVNPRVVYQKHLRELKILMNDGVNIKGLTNNQRYNEGGILKVKPDIQ